MVICPNKHMACVWRLLTASVIVWAQWIRFPETRVWRHFVYFTNQTNLMALALVGTLLFMTWRYPESHIPSGLHTGVSFLLTVTMCVYWLVLFEGDSANLHIGEISASLLAGFILHALSPIMVLVDWILFVPHGQLCLRHAFMWQCYPLCYCIWIFLRAELGPRLTQTSRYPYPFMDMDLYTFQKVLLYGITLFSGFLLLGFLYVGVDQGLGAKGRKRRLLQV